MTDAIIAFFAAWPPSLAVIALSALPVTELRATIPVAIASWSMSPMVVLGLAVLGNLLPFFPLYFGLDALRTWCAKHAAWLVRPIDAMLARSERKVSAQYVRYGALALFLFTAIPLPLTGLWTATLAAVALKIPMKAAFVSIACGVLAAGIIVTMLSFTADAVLG